MIEGPDGPKACSLWGLATVLRQLQQNVINTVLGAGGLTT